MTCWRRLPIQCRAHLVEIGHLQVGAALDVAAVRLQRAQDQLQQRGFAGAIGPDQADLVAAQDGGVQLVDDALVAKRQAHVLQLGHQLALVAARARVHVEAHAAHGLAPHRTRGPQGFEPIDAALRSGAARFHPLADPDLFLSQQLVGAGVDGGLLGHLFFLLHLIGGEVARIREQLAPVQLDDARRHGIEEGAIVRDHHHAALERQQQLLKPADRIQVQVVGRLVQQQHIWPGHQRLGQRNPFARATGQRTDPIRGRQPQALQCFFHPLLPGPSLLRFDLRLQPIQIVTAS